MFVKIAQVNEVHAVILKTFPPTLFVGADGEVPTGGYTDPELAMHIYIVPPADGIYEFSFIARQPDGFVTQVFTPIKARQYVQPIPEGLKGVRVCGSNNCIEVMLDSGKAADVTTKKR